MKHIIDNLFLSNLQDALNPDLIAKNNINIVVRLSEDDKHPASEYYDRSIEYYNYVLEDNCLYTKEIIQYSKEIYALIESKPDSYILIHCNEGQSRSVSVFIYYLMTKHKYSFDDALRYIQHIKPDVNPNYSFEQVLRNYDI